MSYSFHPTSLIEEGAQIEEGVKIGPYTIIGKNVKIGKNTEIGAFCVIEGFTEIGTDNKIFSHAVIGSDPQDLKYKGERSFVKIGDGNLIREFVTINPGTEKDSVTLIGDRNLIMAYSHIAHNCKIGNNCILANCATLAGFVEIEDFAVIGGMVAIHQFCRVGKYSIIGGCSKVVQDIPPYSLCDGHPAEVKGLNLVGLKRRGFSKETINILNKAFKILFFSNLPFSSGFEKIKQEKLLIPEVEVLLEFIKSSKRGVCRPK